MDKDQSLRNCLQVILSGHTITTRKWSDGYDESFAVNTNAPNQLYDTDEITFYRLDNCPLVKCDIHQHGDYTDTTYKLNPREHNPNVSMETATVYGMASIRRSYAIAHIDTMLKMLLYECFGDIDTEAAKNAITTTKIALINQQAQARMAYLDAD